MNIEAINTFLLLCETGNFSRVAQKSNLTQSTISARIKVLEDNLGVALFERTSTGVHLTEAGKKFYRYAVTLRQTWQQGRQELARSADPNETFGLGIHMTMWRRFMPNWLVWMRERQSELSLQVEADYSERLADYISQGVLDLAITHMPTGQPGLEIKPFTEDELVMVSRIERDYNFCKPDDYVFVDWSYGYREEHQEKLPELKLSNFNIGYGEMALAYLHVSDCYSYMPQEYVSDDLKNGLLHVVTDAPTLSRPSYLVYSEEPNNPEIVQLAIDGLKASIKGENIGRE